MTALAKLVPTATLPVSLPGGTDCTPVANIAATGFRFAGLHIDVVQRELRRDGKTIHLEPQVFELLIHLVRHRHRVVGKDELIDAIWKGRIVSDAALSSRISAARRAIGDSGEDQRLIRTLHKRGFRFIGRVDAAPASADEATRMRAATGAPRAAAAGLTSIDAARASIVTLPFENLSGNPENEYFGYGISDDLTRLLARNRWLTVISRHSTVAFQGRRIDARELGQSLGVRYVLPGSVRREKDAVRITAELVRSADGAQLWGETYNLRLESIFDVQEQIARQIAATIEPELSKVEQQLAARKTPANLDAWDCCQRGLWHLWFFTREGFDRAEEFFARAAASEPGLARAHAGLGYVSVQRALYAPPVSRPKHLESALALARAAVALDSRDAFARTVLGRALSLLGRNEEAAAELDAAIDLNPSFAQAYFAQGFNLLWAGRASDATALLDRAIRLSPRDSHLWSFYHVGAWAHFSSGDFARAAEFARCATRQPNVTYRAFATLAASLGHLTDGCARDAAAAELLRRRPDYCARLAREEFFFCHDGSFLARFLAGLRSAGIPD